MVREPRKSFDKIFINKGRAEHIDFDYLDKLSDEDKAWLGRFSDEYYGASFQINPTYVIKKDFLTHFESVIKSETNPTKVIKFQKQLDYYSTVKGKHIQISGHYDKWMNVDLRKVRSISRFYKTAKGNLTDNTDYKYSSDNIHPSPELKSCNDRSNAMQRDLLGNGVRNEMVNEHDFDVMIEAIEGTELSQEDKMILIENMKEEYKIRDLE